MSSKEDLRLRSKSQCKKLCRNVNDAERQVFSDDIVIQSRLAVRLAFLHLFVDLQLIVVKRIPLQLGGT